MQEEEEVSNFSQCQFLQQRVELLDYPLILPVIKRLLYVENLENIQPAGRYQYFLKNWGKLTNNPLILELVKGYQIPFLSEPSQTAPPSSISMSQEETAIVDQEIQEMLKKDTIKLVQPNTKKSISKFNIYGSKKGLQTSPCDKPKEIEQRHSLYPSQNGGLFLLKKALLKRDYMCKIDLKDAYFSVPLNPESQKFVSFKWKDLIYQFLCLCFVLGPAPRIFFKVTECSHFSDEKVKCSIDNLS